MGDTWEWSADSQLGETALRVLPDSAYEQAIIQTLAFLRNPEKLQQAVDVNRVSIAAQFDSSVVAQRFLEQIGVTPPSSLAAH